MSRNRISISDKWSWNGDGDLGDLIVFPPAIKVFVVEPLTILAQRGGPAARTVFIYLLALQVTDWKHAIGWTFLSLIALSLIRAHQIHFLNNRESKQLKRLSQLRPMVPLDRNPRRAIATSVTLDRSIMIGGESGSGKSNVIWLILRGIREHKIPAAFYVIDPAGGVELQELEHAPETLEYVERPRDAEPMIQKVHSHMERRLKDMKARQIKEHSPTEDEPLILLIIDDLLLIGTAKQDATTPLGEILAVGRKAGFIVVGATQLNQVDAIGRIRDLFPQRIAMRAPSSEASKAILGQSEPDSSTLFTVGHGYVHIDGQRDIQDFATPYISAKEKREIAQDNVQTLPTPHDNLRSRRTGVYRLFSSQDVLLYVGISDNPSRRLSEHAQDEDKLGWWPSVDATRTKIEWYPNRTEAEQEETRAINEEHPIYNVAKVQI